MDIRQDMVVSEALLSTNSNPCSGVSGTNFNKFDVASTVTASPLDSDSTLGFYETVQSPLPTVYEQRVNYQSRRSLALLINYFAAGLFHGVVPALVYPLFKIRLGLQGYQTNATQTLLGYGFRTFTLVGRSYCSFSV
ncbi:uncharacterized protein PITG_19988 [Phytophthora infestans T30-4]|uniref:Transmembrane protein, putative n=1 Tax=Phytophthora infestans (strain T30-4) TaxID=403677 RepID=D0P1V0_PHYIT|nr:uncharacterized protein PITG_19988 [Phytophthora infestans T30-4]EEY55083.1 transmembrane protein, putative [Phytophthora infestans T30-4]|eukprot:XP_002895713.1 transmembrane protein, putative [Phytophthora infestans T30-4]